ncbi:MAG: cell wall hydrolase [Dongiaceae bacterium]
MSKDLDILARTIYGEARGENIEGKVAVANVILNRFRKVQAIKKERPAHQFSHLFGNGITLEATCLRPWQFSCWNNNDPNREKILAVKGTDLFFNECIAVAKVAIAGLLVDNTKGSTHYHVLSDGFPPSWKKPGEADHEPAVIIGKHAFYNTVK